MALMSWDPFTALAQLDSTFDELIRHSFGTRTQHYVPGVDMATDGSDVVISMELPGVHPDDADIEVVQGRLTVSGERRDTLDQQRGRLLVRELRYGTFRRSFQLPDGVDADRIEARYDNGALTVRVKDVTRPMEQPRKIAVRSAAPVRQIEGASAATDHGPRAETSTA